MSRPDEVRLRGADPEVAACVASALSERTVEVDGRDVVVPLDENGDFNDVLLDVIRVTERCLEEQGIDEVELHVEAHSFAIRRRGSASSG